MADLFSADGDDDVHVAGQPGRPVAPLAVRMRPLVLDDVARGRALFGDEVRERLYAEFDVVEVDAGDDDVAMPRGPLPVRGRLTVLLLSLLFPLIGENLACKGGDDHDGATHK